MLSSSNLINLTNIKKEIFDADDDCENLTSSSTLANNQTRNVMNLKVERPSISSLNDCSIKKLSEARVLLHRLPSSDFINSINIKKEPLDPDDEYGNLINSSTSTNNQIHDLMNSKFKPASIPSLNGCSTEILSEARVVLHRLHSSDFIKSINVKKEPFDSDGQCDNMISPSRSHKNQTYNLMNLKLEPSSIPSLNDCSTKILLETSIVQNQIVSNSNEILMPIIKQESMDIKIENCNTSDAKADLETSLTSVKNESYGNLTDLENYSLNEDPTEFKKNHCDICGKNFLSQRILERHCNNVHAEIKKRIWKCNFCEKSFLRKNNLQVHERSVHDKIRDWRCTHCDKSFTQKYSLKLHERSVHDKIRDWKCTHCDKSFTQKYSLKLHERSVHDKIRDWKCTHCDKSFTRKCSLKLHEHSVHDKIQWRCTHCDKSFTTKYYLKLHERAIHLKTRDWECKECEKTFMSRRNLVAHERFIHTKIQDWKCTQCDKIFNFETNLKRHERIVHLKIRDWKCAQCDKSFVNRYNLIDHERTKHLNIRDWKCSPCNKSFQNKNNSKRHERSVHFKTQI